MTLLRPEPRKNIYEQPFWDFVQEHRLRLQRCSDCGRMRYPPAPVCADCLSDNYTWEPVSGHGTLLSWVVFHRQYFAELPTPYCVAAAQLAEGPILIANLVDPPGEPWLGMSVTLTYEQVRASTDDGHWWIYQWRSA
jgi:uncharacterized OB-fold protein